MQAEQRPNSREFRHPVWSRAAIPGTQSLRSIDRHQICDPLPLIGRHILRRLRGFAVPKVIRLSVVTGPHRGEKFCFSGAAECMMGRAADCFVQLAGTDRDQYISRRHCQMVVDSSALTLHDLGSRCGTYLGGRRIRTATLDLPRCDGGCTAAAMDFDQGSLLTIGGTTLRIDLVDCPPRDTPGGDIAMLWKHGEMCKRDCPLPCGDTCV
jgi:hypothetical protein